MPLIDIAFQAEISRYEDEEFAEHARRNCDELPDTRNKAIAELLQLINDGDCKIRRTDDAYLLRFLRARKFVTKRAYRLMVRYEDFRKKYAYLYQDVEPFRLKRSPDVYEGVIPDCPDNGRITIMKVGMWDSNTMPVEEVTQCAVIMNEICIMQPKIQVLGVTAILDLEGLTMNQVRYFTPSMARHLIGLLGVGAVSFPLLVHGIHVINYSWVINSTMYVFKPFIPAYAWDRIHFHGSDMTSLHRHIKPCYLPPKYGGSCKNVVPAALWLDKVNEFKDDFLVEELKALGYKI